MLVKPQNNTSHKTKTFNYQYTILSHYKNQTKTIPKNQNNK